MVALTRDRVLEARTDSDVKPMPPYAYNALLC